MNELKEQILEITDEYGELHRDYCALNNEDGADDGCDCLMEDLVDDLMQLIETYTAKKELEARLRGQLEIVRSANCIEQADEPAIDEIWFDLAYDSEIVPMRKDTMITYLKQEIDKITQLSSQLKEPL